MITALFAATIAVAQNDIKKVLAYSTVSQLGYMFLAVGSGAYVAAIFHMVTHAFFKALLFLGSGSVIHGMHDEQDMRRMGALRKLMPITAATFIVGWLAIAGVPPFAGFWSKDEILLFALRQEPGAVRRRSRHRAAHRLLHDPPGGHGVLRRGALGGRTPRSTARTASSSPTSRPPIMLFPLVVLAVLSTVGGMIKLPAFRGSPTTGSTSSAAGWIPSSSSARPRSATPPPTTTRACCRSWRSPSRWPASSPPTRCTAARRARRSSRRSSPRAGTTTSSSPVHGRARVAEAFDAVAWFDRTIIDGAVMGAGRTVLRAAGQLRKGQTGNIRNYAEILGIGVVLLLAWFVIARGVL